MNGITDPLEEFFTGGLWGWVTDQWRKLVATAAGALHVYIAGQADTLTVDLDVPSSLAAQNYGWDGANWRKLPLLYGYSDRYAERHEETVPATSDRVLTFSTVPSGEIWIVYIFSARVVSGEIVDIALRANTNSISCVVNCDVQSSIGRTVGITSWLVLKPGDHLDVYFINAIKDSVLHAYAWGVKMKVTQ
jgi:hypothetical protein